MMNTEKILSNLVAFKTESSEAVDYSECAEYIAHILREIDFDVEIVDGGDGKIAKPNILAQKITSRKNETILYAAHFDVVPPGDGWRTDPWQATEKDGKIFGRGCSDDKAAIAILVQALHEQNPTANIKALFTCDEEIGGADGLEFVTHQRKDWLRDIDLAWIADAGTDMIGIGASGVLGGRIIVRGKGGHAGYPHRADNAVHKLIELASALRKYEDINETKRSRASAPPESPHDNVWGRFNITILSAGTKTNVIPEQAEAGFDLRFLPEENKEDAIAEFDRFFKRTVEILDIDARYSVVYGHEGYLQPIGPIIERFGERVMNALGKKIPYGAELGGNDGHFLFNMKIPTICFAPIESNSQFHMANEFIRIETLDKMSAVVREVFCNWEI